MTASTVPPRQPCAPPRELPRRPGTRINLRHVPRGAAAHTGHRARLQQAIGNDGIPARRDHGKTHPVRQKDRLRRATGLPLRGSAHSQKAKVWPGAGSTVNRRDFQLVSVTGVKPAGNFLFPQLRTIHSRATVCTASNPVTSTMISAGLGSTPSANSRFPSGARKESPA